MKFDFRGLSDLIAIARRLQDLNLAFEKEHDLSLTQWLVLGTLKDLPGCTALSLAKALAVQPSSLTQLLKRLEKKYLIHISSDPKDSRKKRLVISRDGKVKFETLAPKIESELGHLNFQCVAELSTSLNGNTRENANSLV